MAHRNEPDAERPSERAWELADQIVETLRVTDEPMVIFHALELALAAFALRMPSPDMAEMMVSVMAKHINQRISDHSYDPTLN